ncbi:hypothetical protein Tco_1023187 [Tanacetum coccineum]
MMNELVYDGINLSKLEINTSFINGLPKKWLTFCQILRNTNHVKESELASLFGKPKYEENLIDSIYETKKKKSLVSATPLSTAFISTSIDEEEVSSDDNEMVEVKVFMALADDNDAVSKEGARNGECSNKVNQCISEQIPTQKKRILGADQLIEVSSSSGKKRLGLSESQRNTIDPLVAVTDSFATDYDSADESSVCSTPIPPLEKLVGAEPISGPKTIKSILKSNSTFKAEALKGVIINEPSSAHAKGNKCERTDHRTCDHAEHMSTMNITQHLKGQVGSSSRSRTPRPSKHFFSPCIHYGFSDHLSDDCVNYSICDICGSYDHDTYGHNRIISLRRGIKPKNPHHVMQSCETYGSIAHTITGHNDIEWFRRGEALQAKKAEALKTNKTKTSNANRSKTPTKR